MFYAFLSEYNQSVNDFEFELWMKYFNRHARYRTLCYECSQLIEKLYKQGLKKKRLTEALPEDDEEMNIIMMSKKGKQRWLDHIAKRSKRAKQIIHEWVKLARYNLHPSLMS